LLQLRNGKPGLSVLPELALGNKYTLLSNLFF